MCLVDVNISIHHWQISYIIFLLEWFSNQWDTSWNLCSNFSLFEQRGHLSPFSCKNLSLFKAIFGSFSKTSCNLNSLLEFFSTINSEAWKSLQCWKSSNKNKNFTFGHLSQIHKPLWKYLLFLPEFEFSMISLAIFDWLM